MGLVCFFQFFIQLFYFVRTKRIFTINSALLLTATDLLGDPVSFTFRVLLFRSLPGVLSSSEILPSPGPDLFFRPSCTFSGLSRTNQIKHFLALPKKIKTRHPFQDESPAVPPWLTIRRFTFFHNGHDRTGLPDTSGCSTFQIGFPPPTSPPEITSTLPCIVLTFLVCFILLYLHQKATSIQEKSSFLRKGFVCHSFAR